MDPAPVVTIAEYLAFEDASQAKHDLLDGRIVRHQSLPLRHHGNVANLLVLLGTALRRSRRARVHRSDQRVHEVATGFDGYPDLSIVCDEDELSPTDRRAIVNPSVVIEVISPSTEAVDRGAKWRRYRRIASLREDLLVAGYGEPEIERFERIDRSWSYRAHGGDDAHVTLTSCDVTLPLARVFADAPPEQ